MNRSPWIPSEYDGELSCFFCGNSEHEGHADDCDRDGLRDIFIAICVDRHIDKVVRVFSTAKKAIAYCKEFMEDDEYEETVLNDAMIAAGWIYHAIYSCEGDSVRVEKGKIDNDD